MSAGSEHFNFEAWGRLRLLFLQLGYVFLTMKADRLDDVTRSLIDSMDLSSRIGQISIKMASAEERPGLMLAERIYTYVISQDDKAYEAAKSAGCPDAYVFRDPLVYSRYASSLFLQERFGQAKTVLDQILFTDESWLNLDDRNFARFDVSKFEMLMRHSQYTFLRYYSQDDKIVDNLKWLIKGFDPVLDGIRDNGGEFDAKRFRAVCWYYMCAKYVETLNIITPTFMIVHRDEVDSYLTRHIAAGAADGLVSKPEVMCVRYLLSHKASGKRSGVLGSVKKDMSRHRSYPSAVIACFIDMLDRIDAHRSDTGVGRPKVFVSYSHGDKGIADRIINYMGESGIEVLSDKQFIVGDSLLNGMQRAIQNAEVCIILVSKNYLESAGWLEKERETILAKNVDGETDVVVLAYGVAFNEIRSAQPMLANGLIVKLNDERLEGELYKVSGQIQTIVAKRRRSTRSAAISKRRVGPDTE